VWKKGNEKETHGKCGPSLKEGEMGKKVDVSGRFRKGKPCVQRQGKFRVIRRGVWGVRVEVLSAGGSIGEIECI